MRAPPPPPPARLASSRRERAAGCGNLVEPMYSFCHAGIKRQLKRFALMTLMENECELKRFVLSALKYESF